MLTVTFSAARRARACARGYDQMAAAKGGDAQWGTDRPIPLLEVMDELGLNDTLWALRIAQPEEERDRVARLVSCDYAERVLPLFTAQYPGDQRPRQAIEVARRYARGQATRDKLDATSDAARDAADAAGAAWAAWAAWAAGAAGAAEAADAAGAAWAARAARDARAAERQWQAARLRQYLTGEVQLCE